MFFSSISQLHINQAKNKTTAEYLSRLEISMQRKEEARAHPANQLLPDISFENFTAHTSDYHKISTFQKFINTNSKAV